MRRNKNEIKKMLKKKSSDDKDIEGEKGCHFLDEKGREVNIDMLPSKPADKSHSKTALKKGKEKKE